MYNARGPCAKRHSTAGTCPRTRRQEVIKWRAYLHRHDRVDAGGARAEFRVVPHEHAEAHLQGGEDDGAARLEEAVVAALAQQVELAVQLFVCRPIRRYRQLFPPLFLAGFKSVLWIQSSVHSVSTFHSRADAEESLVLGNQ